MPDRKMPEGALKSKHELVTVLMSVYKTDVCLLERAVRSILCQTYSDFEFIIIDDGAGKESRDYLENISDPRVIIIHNDVNIGLAASLNKGIELAKGKFIARMDADDYSLPERIYEQVRYMNDNPDVDVLACISMDIQNDELTGGIGGAYANFDNEDMRIELSIGPKTFPHPTVMFRRSFLNEYNIRYDSGYKRAQDYDMWVACSQSGKLDSLQKALLLYNIEDGRNDEISSLQTYYSDMTKLKCLKGLLPDATENEKDLYTHMKDKEMTGSVDDNLSLVKKLIDANNEKRIYDPAKYEQILYFWWGRKMLYPVNRQYLSKFITYSGFIPKVISSIYRRLPGHLWQQAYIRKTRQRSIKVLKDLVIGS